MRINENLMQIDQGDYVLIKNEATGAVFRVTKEAAKILQALQANDFDVSKAIREVAEATGNAMDAYEVHKFIGKAVALDIVVCDDGEIGNTVGGYRSPMLSTTIISRGSAMGKVLRWIANRKPLIHPTLTVTTVVLAAHMVFIFGRYAPALNGQFLLSFLLFISISFFHEVGHWLVCDFFGGSAGGLGIGIAYWMIPYFWTDLGDIWFFGRRMLRVLSLLGGVWLEFLLSELLVFILYFAQKKEYIGPVLLVLIVRILLDANPFYSDLSLVRREFSAKRRYAFIHVLLWVLAVLEIFRWTRLA